MIATGCVTKLHVIFVFSIHLSVSRGAALFDLSKRALLNPADSACRLYLQQYRRKNGRFSNSGGLKANTTCGSCGKRNHSFKDAECMYNIMRCLVEGKPIDPDALSKQSD